MSNVKISKSTMSNVTIVSIRAILFLFLQLLISPNPCTQNIKIKPSIHGRHGFVPVGELLFNNGREGSRIFGWVDFLGPRRGGG